jgi:beta-lactamase superfamily II metal-dependent hydrolase
MEIYLLDVGERQYGDCILVTHGDRRILIDGGHPGDDDLIGRQLRRLLGEAPHRIDLLIVTHCHADHYGCLPELVENEVIDVQRALVADETLGWPHSPPNDDAAGEDDAPAPPVGSARQILSEALLEEPLTDATDEEVARFLADAMSGEDKYTQMLTAIPHVTRYGTASNSAIRNIEQDFASFGLKILGPTAAHLRTCAGFIYRESHRRRDDAPESDEMVNPADLVASYRRAVARKMAVAQGEADAVDAEDRMGAGSARNNQSIVVKLLADGFSALLAGDMQFAAAEVPGLDDAMAALREKVRSAGPYDFVKLTHHSSYNGVDDSVLEDYPGCRNFAHTGGLYDPTHPDPGVLEILSERRNDLYFARTDRNGLITVKKSGGNMRMRVQRGALNNFERNRRRPRPDDGRDTRLAHEEAVIERLDKDYVEVIARIPHRATRVTVTIDVDPEKKKN